MRSKQNGNNGRAAGKTQISISLPQWLLAKIDVLAAREYRNRSNYIATAMARIAADSTYKPTGRGRKNNGML